MQKYSKNSYHFGNIWENVLVICVVGLISVNGASLYRTLYKRQLSFLEKAYDGLSESQDNNSSKNASWHRWSSDEDQSSSDRHSHSHSHPSSQQAQGQPAQPPAVPAQMVAVVAGGSVAGVAAVAAAAAGLYKYVTGQNPSKAGYTNIDETPPDNPDSNNEPPPTPAPPPTEPEPPPPPNVEPEPPPPPTQPDPSPPVVERIIKPAVEPAVESVPPPPPPPAVEAPIEVDDWRGNKISGKHKHHMEPVHAASPIPNSTPEPANNVPAQPPPVTIKPAAVEAPIEVDDWMGHKISGRRHHKESHGVEPAHQLQPVQAVPPIPAGNASGQGQIPKEPTPPDATPEVLKNLGETPSIAPTNAPAPADSTSAPQMSESAPATPTPEAAPEPPTPPTPEAAFEPPTPESAPEPPTPESAPEHLVTTTSEPELAPTPVLDSTPAPESKPASPPPLIELSPALTSDLESLLTPENETPPARQSEPAAPESEPAPPPPLIKLSPTLTSGLESLLTPGQTQAPAHVAETPHGLPPSPHGPSHPDWHGHHGPRPHFDSVLKEIEDDEPPPPAHLQFGHGNGHSHAPPPPPPPPRHHAPGHPMHRIPLRELDDDD